MLNKPSKTNQESLLAKKATSGGKKVGYHWALKQTLNISTLHHPPHLIHINDTGWYQTDNSTEYIFPLAFYRFPLFPAEACDTNELQVYKPIDFYLNMSILKQRKKQKYTDIFYWYRQIWAYVSTWAMWSQEGKAKIDVVADRRHPSKQSHHREDKIRTADR